MKLKVFLFYFILYFIVLVLNHGASEETPLLFPFVNDHHDVRSVPSDVVDRVHPLLLGEVSVEASLHHTGLNNTAIAVNELSLVDTSTGGTGEPTTGTDGVVHHHTPLVELLTLVVGEGLGAVPLTVEGEGTRIGLGVDLLPGLFLLVGVSVVSDGEGKHGADVDLVGLEGLLETGATFDLVGVLDGEEVTEHVGPDEPADDEANSSKMSVEHFVIFLEWILFIFISFFYKIRIIIITLGSVVMII